jgi:hypothetical protein
MSGILFSQPSHQNSIGILEHHVNNARGEALSVADISSDLPKCLLKNYRQWHLASMNGSALLLDHNQKQSQSQIRGTSQRILPTRQFFDAISQKTIVTPNLRQVRRAF